MIIPRSEFLIPPGKEIKQAFLRAGQATPEIPTLSSAELTNLPGHILQRASLEHLFAGLAFMKHCGHDQLIQTVGQTAWDALVSGKLALSVMISQDIQGIAELTRSTPEVVQELTDYPGEPNLMIEGQIGANSIWLRGSLFILPEFLRASHTQPEATLANLGGIGSKVRDFANNKIAFQEELVQARSTAVQAHLLHEALRQDPSLVLSDRKKLLLAAYPEGTANLPPGVIY